MRVVASRVCVAAAFAIAALSSNPASADLPRHLAIASLQPTKAELYAPGAQPSDTEPLQFGFASTIRNGNIFVGMPAARPTGRVAVYTQSIDGQVQRTQTLAAADPSDSNFGSALNFRDGVLLVGSSSAVYVFKRFSGIWRRIQKLSGPANQGILFFPTSFKYEAGILAIGASRSTGPDAVYLYKVSADTGKFVNIARLTAADGAVDDGFGASVGVTSSAIAIGAPGKGAVYVFRRDSLTGRWVQAQKLVPRAPEHAGGFGASLAIDNDMILAGAPFADPEGHFTTVETPDDHTAGGAVYGFVVSDGRFVEKFRLRPRPDQLFDYTEFGWSIAIFGGHVAISAYSGDELPRPAEAFAVTYTRTGSSVVISGIAEDLVGTHVSIANTLLLVSNFVQGCSPSGDFCTGSATLFDLNRFQP